MHVYNFTNIYIFESASYWRIWGMFDDMDNSEDNIFG